MPSPNAVRCNDIVKYETRSYALDLSIRWRLHRPADEFPSVGGDQRDGRDRRDAPEEAAKHNPLET